MSDEENRFNSPRLAINRVYTRHGDGGLTRLVGGQEVPKSDLRLEAYGTVDELNAFVGVCRVSTATLLSTAPEAHRGDLSALGATLLHVQHALFNLGSILAILPEDVHPRQPRTTQADVDALERSIDASQEQLPPL